MPESTRSWCRRRAWRRGRASTGITAEAADLQGAVKVLAPTVNYRMNEASATRAPWVVANGWKFIRRPQGRFYYDVTGKQAALAAAEAFCYGANAMIRTDAAGLKPLAEMLDFLRTIAGEPLPPVADIGYIDDGSSASGEVMNLMVRDNLLFQLVTAPDRRLKLNVKLGTKEYPLADAKNPGTVAHAVRFNLTDEKRSVRIYGSQVVVARLTGAGRPCAAASAELCGGEPEGGWDSRARARPISQTPAVGSPTARASNCSTTAWSPTPPSSRFRN